MQRVNSASQVVLDDMSDSEDLESDLQTDYYNARPLEVSTSRALINCEE